MEYLQNEKQAITQLLFSLLIFLTPSNLFKVLDTDAGYVSGLRVDYLVPKLYVSDIFLILLTVYLVFNSKKTILKFIHHQTELIQFIVLFILLCVTQLVRPDPLVSILFLGRISLLFTTGILILSSKNKKVLSSLATQITVFTTFLFQSSIAIVQFITQSSVASYLFLGETNLQSFAGIAKGTINHVEYILPYGTTAHPNILAGTVVILFFILLLQLNKKKIQKSSTITGVAFILTATIIFLTQSFSAGLSLILGLLLYVSRAKFPSINFLQIFLVSLLVGILVSFSPSESQSIERRAYLNEAAITAFLKNPFWGVGIQKFTGVVEKYSSASEVVRFTQPAHNVPLLLISELGLIGLALIGLIIQILTNIAKSSQSANIAIFLIVFPILTLDHYLYTIQTGLLLMWLILIYSNLEKPVR